MSNLKFTNMQTQYVCKFMMGNQFWTFFQLLEIYYFQTSTNNQCACTCYDCKKVMQSKNTSLLQLIFASSFNTSSKILDLFTSTQLFLCNLPRLCFLLHQSKRLHRCLALLVAGREPIHFRKTVVNIPIIISIAPDMLLGIKSHKSVILQCAKCIYRYKLIKMRRIIIFITLGTSQEKITSLGFLY